VTALLEITDLVKRFPTPDGVPHIVIDIPRFALRPGLSCVEVRPPLTPS
jgi:hypothetical protein